MLIFEKEVILSEKNDKTNIYFKFNTPKGISKLLIDYSYSPKRLESKEKSYSIINAKLKEYGNDDCVEDFLPLNNLITVSLDKNGTYIGAAHRQPNHQHIEISPDSATVGFFKTNVDDSEWRIALNVHCALEEIKVNLKITGV